MSVFVLDLGYTVKYNPLPSGKGLYLTVYPSSRPNMDTVFIATGNIPAFCKLCWSKMLLIA